MTLVRALARVLSCLALSLALTGCFVSQGLFERDRIWDPAWFGRYETGNTSFVVLPDDPSARTYLVGGFGEEKTGVDVYRVALYRGWNDVMILGSLGLGKSDPGAIYISLRPLGHDRFASQWPDCSEDFARRHGLVREHEVCTFSTLENLRSALKAYTEEKPTSSSGDNSEPQPLEHRRDHPLSTIGVTAHAGVFNDSEGVHGGLKLLDVPAGSAAAKAGLKPGDLIFAVGDPRPAIGEELLLRIAVAAPGTNLAITYFDAKTHAKREVSVTTVAIN